MWLLIIGLFMLGIVSMLSSKLNIGLGKSVVGLGIVSIVLPELGLVLLVLGIVTIIVMTGMGK